MQAETRLPQKQHGAMVALLLLGSLFRATTAFAIALPTPTGLLTEFLTNPLGIDVNPRFSWSFDSFLGERGSAQSAYQLQVATSPFDGDGPVLWDSGYVSANDSFLISYGGPSLMSDTLYFWRVCAWDAAGAGPTAFSATQSFRTGLLLRSDWHGDWISGHNGSSLLRANFSLPLGRRVVVATAYLVGIGFAQLSCNGGLVDPGRRLESAWTSYAHRVRYMTLDLSRCLTVDGTENVLGIALGNGWFACRGWYALPPYPYPGATNGGGFCYDSPPQALLQVRSLRFGGLRVVN
jgi:alpha-L-rhamnosidase